MNASSLYMAKNLEFAYGPGQSPALSIPKLEIGEGECLAFSGPNGSGKTTLLMLLNDLSPGGGESTTFAGELWFRGEPVRRDAARFHPRALRKSTVYIHQHPYIFSGSVARNLNFACRSRGIRGQAATDASTKALALVGLQDFASRKQKGLSSGEAQRVALARIIASGAEVLLLDEPTASADAASRDRIVEALSLLAKSGTTIIFSTHEEDIIDRIATRVLVFERGAIIRDSGRRYA